jgi:Uri superfamily endonuclease
MNPRGRRRIQLHQVPAEIEPEAGTYSLLFECDTPSEVSVGRLGRLKIQLGVYCYVGSALGSGGVRARVKRHLTPVTNKHWHIDYVRESLRLTRIMFTYSDRRLEHAWARALLRLSEAVPAIAGFGASDCHCPAHLIYFRGWPDRVQFGETLVGASPRAAVHHEILIAK